MKTLLELIQDMEQLGEREAVRHATGYRTRVWSYRELLACIGGISEHFEACGVARGDRILLWGENRPEWIATFWAALSRGVVVVPIDFRSSRALAERVHADVGAKLLVHGPSVDASLPGVAKLSLERAGELRSTRVPPSVDATPDDIVQILYTSGTTGEPKGVVQRHRNLVANLDPIRREARNYAAIAWPFQPIRTLVLVPTSHVFGQFTGLFVPVVLGGAVAFVDAVHPKAILETIERERISVLSTVPRLLSGLRREIERRFEVDPAHPLEGGLPGGLLRWWRYRAVHRALGLKFWAVLSGGARLPEDDEAFWLHLGIALIQGYGLTETSSVVATNHPFHPKRGSLGKTVGDQQVKLGPDGEILVRGDNVSREYYGKKRDSAGATDEWLHTGDVGEIRDDGVLYYVGRKKDVIVGADGMNVHPMDVERELDREPEVRESVVVGRPADAGDIVHAVLLADESPLTPEVASAIIARVNGRLEPHQRIREWTVWPDEDLPRTPSTLKVLRHEVLARLGDPSRKDSSERGPRALLARHLGRRSTELAGAERLTEELGLTSLDRMELQARLEGELGRELSETAMASVETVDDLVAIARSEAPPDADISALDGIVRYARLLPVRLVRAVFRETVIRPLFRHYLPLTVEGDVDAVTGPVVFAANHLSNLDTLAVLTALPYRHRDRLAPAIGQEFFDPYLRRTGTFRERVRYAVLFWLTVVLVNVFPLPRTAAASRRSLRFAGGLVDDGYSVLIFPEGKLSRDGDMDAFRPGVGLLAVRLGIPVVPIHLRGLFEVLPHTQWWPKAGPVGLRIGAPLHFSETDDAAQATATIERAVRGLAPAIE